MFLADYVWYCFASWLTAPSLSFPPRLEVDFIQPLLFTSEVLRSVRVLRLLPLLPVLSSAYPVFWWGWEHRETLKKKVKRKAVIGFLVLGRRKLFLTSLPYSSSSQDAFKNRKDLKLMSEQLILELLCRSQQLSIVFNTQTGQRSPWTLFGLWFVSHHSWGTWKIVAVSCVRSVLGHGYRNGAGGCAKIIRHLYLPPTNTPELIQTVLVSE